MSYKSVVVSLQRWRECVAGGASMIFAYSAPILCLAMGVAIDFTNATIVRSKLNAAADAAALAALTPAMMQQSDSAAEAAALAVFNAQANAIASLEANSAEVTVTIAHPGDSLLSRTVTVNYSASETAIFSGVLRLPTLGIAGTSTAQASLPPNIDFYLLLDNSPSMSLPATSAGITQMQALTSKQYGGAGCAFACHQASTNNSDTIGNPCSDGSLPTLGGGQFCAVLNLLGLAITQVDNYTLARLNNIPLRLDELSSGISQLMQVADDYQISGQYSTPPSYRFAAYEMDSPWTVGTANYLLMSLNADYINQWSSLSANFGVMEMFSNGVGCANPACSAGVGFNDVATNYDVALSSINAAMPDPGQGTNIAGDTPQEVLFFVTDGVEDEQNLTRLIQPINAGMSTNYCTLIKNRGVKIAVLYTEYLPVPVNSFYETYVAPIQSDLGPALEACASPGLYYDAGIGDDLGRDLTTLFQIVVQSAALSH